MSTDCQVSDELLNAFVDGEMDAVEKARLLDLMAAEPPLRARVCQLWQTKEMVRGAYPLAAPRAGKPGHARFALGRHTQALAASVMLAVGALAGWIAHGEQRVLRQETFQWNALHADAGKVILHLNSDAPPRLNAALDEAERLSNSVSKDGHPVQVELLANGGGLSLVRADVSPYGPRIASLLQKHRNLNIVACNNAIEALSLAGVEVRLLPHVAVASTALDEIMARLKQGWTYMQA